MTTSRKQGVLVTGSPRSGTTWAGKMLALASGTRYLHEPLNNRFAVEQFEEEPFPYWFMYISDFNESEYKQKIGRMLGLAGRPAGKPSNQNEYPVIKDPIAVFSSDWMSRTFDLDVILMVRHPAAFVRSILKLGWNTRPRVFLRQRPLLESWLQPMERELRIQLEREDPLTDAALMWKAIHLVVIEYRKRNPDWILARHEDLAKSPLDAFRNLYQSLGLKYSPDVENQIRNHCSNHNPSVPRNHWDISRDSRLTTSAWQQYFTDDQLKIIRQVVEPVSSHFYSDDEWRTG